jgi:GNAT superfamily N-acetyltransferase
VGFGITTVSFGLEYGRSAELEDLFVVPGRRRSGIGGALIDDSANWASLRGCRTLEIVVAPMKNDVVNLFGYYGRQGFTDEGRRLLSRGLAH